jgi:hypothetical protein
VRRHVFRAAMGRHIITFTITESLLIYLLVIRNDE